MGPHKKRETRKDGSPRIRMGADAINLRRLCRCCENLVSNTSDPHCMQRIGFFIPVLKDYVDKLEKSQVGGHVHTGISDEELVEFKRKISLFEKFGSTNYSYKKPTEVLEEKASVKMPLVMNEDSKRRELFSNASSFHSFMNQGELGISKQLELMEDEQTKLKDNLDSLVGTLKQRVHAVNAKITTDTHKIDLVSRKAEQNLSKVITMRERLGDTLSSTSMNCKMCTAGIFLVVGLWMLAYVVMRLFPKVKY